MWELEPFNKLGIYLFKDYYIQKFHSEIKYGNLPEVKKLIELGANPQDNYYDSKYYQPIIIACQYNQINIIRYLLSLGVKFENCYHCPIETAINNVKTFENIDLIKFLIKNGANINLRGTLGQNPLMLAIEKKDINLCKFLLENGADLEIIDDDYNDALSIAINNKNHIKEDIDDYKDLLELLISKTNNINKIIKKKYDKSLMPDTDYLKIAIHKNNLEALQLLINYGADINQQDEYGNSALHHACFYQKGFLIALILAHKSKVNQKNKQGDTPLNVFLKNFYSKNNSTKSSDMYTVFSLLIKYGASPMIRNNQNKAALDLLNELWDTHYYNDCREIIIDYTKNFFKLKKQIFESINSDNIKQFKKISKKITLGLYDDIRNNPLHLANPRNLEMIFLIFSIRPELIIEKNNAGKTPIDLNPEIILSLSIFMHLGKIEIR